MRLLQVMDVLGPISTVNLPFVGVLPGNRFNLREH